MQNKPRNRTDVQWVISSVSLAVTVGLWGLFAGHEKKGAGVTADVALTPPTDQQVVVSQPQMLAPGQVLLFGGTAPQPPVQQVIVSQGRSKHRGGGGATTSTGSSRP